MCDTRVDVEGEVLVVWLIVSVHTVQFKSR